MPGGVSNVVIHGTRPDGTTVDFPPMNSIPAAVTVANEAVQDGVIVDYYITYTDSHGNEIRYDQV